MKIRIRVILQLQANLALKQKFRSYQHEKPYDLFRYLKLLAISNFYSGL